MVPDLGHQTLLRSCVTQTQLRNTAEFITNFKASSRGGLAILGDKNISVIDRVLQVAGEPLRRDEPLAAGTERAVILAVNAIL